MQVGAALAEVDFNFVMYCNVSFSILRFRASSARLPPLEGLVSVESSTTTRQLPVETLHSRRRITDCRFVCLNGFFTAHQRNMAISA
jgi:hypothetical protein